MATFGERLRKLRKEKKLSQGELGRVFQMSESAIGMYERNEREPSFDTTKKMADYFGVPRAYMLGDTDDPSPADKQSDDDDIETIAAHHVGDDWTEEELEEIERFKEFVRMKRKEREEND